MRTRFEPVTVRPGRLLTVAAVAAVVFELWWLAADVDLGWGPTMPVLPSTVVVPFLVVAWRRAVQPAVSVRLGPFVTVAAVVAVAAAAGAGDPMEAVEVAVASSAEEVVYRVGLPLLLYLAARRWTRGHRTAVLAALASSSMLFALLPGHVSQASRLGWPVLAWFAAMALLWGLTLWSTGSVLLVAACHATVNLTILPVEAGGWPTAVRGVAVVATMAALLWTVHDVQTRRAAVPAVPPGTVAAGGTA